MASQFGVAAWSTNFYQIVFCITERSDALMEIIAGLEMDDDLKNDARRHLKDIRQAFARDSLSKSWQDVGAKHLRRENVQPIKMLSPYVRQKIFYPKLDDEEVKELLELLAKLQDWLEKQQLAEQDFVRQAIWRVSGMFAFGSNESGARMGIHCKFNSRGNRRVPCFGKWTSGCRSRA
ncbi:hypothetical protein AJ88_25025 [Mesorhizobium amorphae CCBAU 01583]|nr:hypothetical protein AJ88_25025 [Mesorhizobium amorphae CCBAU 01583]